MKHFLISEQDLREVAWIIELLHETLMEILHEREIKEEVSEEEPPLF